MASIGLVKRMSTCAAELCYPPNNCMENPNANDNVAAVNALLDEVVANVLIAESATMAVAA